MNNYDIDKIFESLYFEYNERTEGSYYAFTCLANAYHFIRLLPISDDRKEKWLSKVKNVKVDCGTVRDIEEIVDNDIKRIERVIRSGSDKYNDDEIMLILSERIDIDLVQKCLKFIGKPGKKRDYAHIDERIIEIAKCNKIDYLSTVKQFKMNSGYPIEHPLLSIQ